MKKTHIALSLALVSLLFACTDKTVNTAPPAHIVVKAASKPAPAPSTKAKIDEMLMKAVFGPTYDAGNGEIVTAMSDLQAQDGEGQFLVAPVGSTILANGVTAFVTSGQRVNEEGRPEMSFGTGGLMSVFFMRQRDGKWEILKRLENIDELGSNGQLGGVQWPMLGKGKQGLALTSSYSTQGLELDILTLFEVTDSAVRKVTDEGILIASTNDGDCDEELAMACYDTSGKWRMVPPKVPGDYDDLLLEATSTTSTAPGERKEPATGPRVTETVSGTARYAFDGKQYKIVEGKNLVQQP